VVASSEEGDQAINPRRRRFPPKRLAVGQVDRNAPLARQILSAERRAPCATSRNSKTCGTRHAVCVMCIRNGNGREPLAGERYEGTHDARGNPRLPGPYVRG